MGAALYDVSMYVCSSACARARRCGSGFLMPNLQLTISNQHKVTEEHTYTRKYTFTMNSQDCLILYLQRERHIYKYIKKIIIQIPPHSSFFSRFYFCSSLSSLPLPPWPLFRHRLLLSCQHQFPSYPFRFLLNGPLMFKSLVQSAVRLRGKIPSK